MASTVTSHSSLESINSTSQKFEAKGMEIKTKSVEQTLVPLVTQITTLVNHKESSLKSERSKQALVRVGQAVQVAVDRFVQVGIAIADENNDIQDDMYGACNEAKKSGRNIAELTERRNNADNTKSHMVRAARGLLSAITRVLLLADRIVLKQLLATKDKVTSTLSKLEGITSFTDFVQAFNKFGSEMVELAHLSGDRQNDLKDERYRALIGVARAILEKCTMMLLTACKVCLRHPECKSSKQVRDTVFVQMRNALQLIQMVITEEETTPTQENNIFNIGPNIDQLLKDFHDTVELTRVVLIDTKLRTKLHQYVESVSDGLQDFTDSAYTTHEHREKILVYVDRLRIDLDSLIRAGTGLRLGEHSDELEDMIVKTIKASQTLRKELQDAALDQASEVFRLNEDPEMLRLFKEAGIAGDLDKVEAQSLSFKEHCDHLLEVCKLMKHVAGNETLKITAQHIESSVRSLGPQLLLSAQSLALYPTSKIAKENLDVFSDSWESLLTDLSLVVKEINDLCHGRTGERQIYMSLPKSGKHGVTPRMMKPMKLDADEQAKMAKLGLEVKLLTSELDIETEKWDDQTNELLRRTKNMSSMAYSMYLFTRGEGPLKTTQDLFTQAEYFAEEGNKLYQNIKQFLIQCPTGCKEAYECHSPSDTLPASCQQLHFMVKSPASGKAATFSKVNFCIHETKNVLVAVVKILPLCFVISTKYSVDIHRSVAMQKWRTQHGATVPTDDTESIRSSKSEASALTRQQAWKQNSTTPTTCNSTTTTPCAFDRI